MSRQSQTRVLLLQGVDVTCTYYENTGEEQDTAPAVCGAVFAGRTHEACSTSVHAKSLCTCLLH